MIEILVKQSARVWISKVYKRDAPDLMDALANGQLHIKPSSPSYRKEFENWMNIVQGSHPDGDAVNDAFNKILLHGTCSDSDLCEAAQHSMVVFGSVKFEWSEEEIAEEEQELARVAEEFALNSLKKIKVVECEVSEDGCFFKDGICIYCGEEEDKK